MNKEKKALIEGLKLSLTDVIPLIMLGNNHLDIDQVLLDYADKYPNETMVRTIKKVIEIMKEEN